MPKSKLGKLSLIFMVIFFVIFIFQTLLVQHFLRRSMSIGDNLLFAAVMIIGGLSAITSFITGMIGIVKDHERSVLVLATTLVGFMILIFVIGEVVIPH